MTTIQVVAESSGPYSIFSISKLRNKKCQKR
jgi:hypothetical protein